MYHYISVTYAFEGGYHGLFIPKGSGRHSVCSHDHKTEDAARRCAKAKRAKYNKEGWTE